MASLIDVTFLYGVAVPVAALQRRVVANPDYYGFSLNLTFVAWD